MWLITASTYVLWKKKNRWMLPVFVLDEGNFEQFTWLRRHCNGGPCRWTVHGCQNANEVYNWPAGSAATRAACHWAKWRAPSVEIPAHFINTFQDWNQMKFLVCGTWEFYLKSAVSGRTQKPLAFGRNIRPFPLEQVNDDRLSVAVGVVLTRNQVAAHQQQQRDQHVTCSRPKHVPLTNLTKVTFIYNRLITKHRLLAIPAFWLCTGESFPTASRLWRWKTNRNLVKSLFIGLSCMS